MPPGKGLCLCGGIWLLCGACFSVLSEIWYNSTNQFLGKQIQKGAERTRGTVGIESDRYEKWR